jgi:hypothetical protein
MSYQSFFCKHIRIAPIARLNQPNVCYVELAVRQFSANFSPASVVRAFQPLNRSFAHSIVHLLTQSFIRSLHSNVHSLTQSFIHSIAHSLTHCLLCSCAVNNFFALNLACFLFHSLTDGLHLVAKLLTATIGKQRCDQRAAACRISAVATIAG